MTPLNEHDTLLARIDALCDQSCLGYVTIVGILEVVKLRWAMIEEAETRVRQHAAAPLVAIGGIELLPAAPASKQRVAAPADITGIVQAASRAAVYELMLQVQGIIGAEAFRDLLDKLGAPETPA